MTRFRAKSLPVFLAILVAFAAIAVFSPIHKHDLNSPSKCSLNHLEAQQAEGAVVVVPAFALTVVGESEVTIEAERPAHVPELPLPARAPPASSC